MRVVKLDNVFGRIGSVGVIRGIILDDNSGDGNVNVNVSFVKIVVGVDVEKFVIYIRVVVVVVLGVFVLKWFEEFIYYIIDLLWKDVILLSGV